VTHLHQFRPHHRLHAPAEFERVYRQGRRAGDNLFGVSALPNSHSAARLGMSVSTRTVGNAVCRNRVRRIIREVFRARLPELPAMDFVVTSRPGARGAERHAIVASVDQLITRSMRPASGAGRA
jgi:ribonuclease P protein component